MTPRDEIEHVIAAMRTARGWVEDGYPSRAVGAIDEAIRLARSALSRPAAPATEARLDESQRGIGDTYPEAWNEAKRPATEAKCPRCHGPRIEGPCAVHLDQSCEGCPDPFHAPSAGEYVDIVFDGPPGPESGRFVEVEDATGKSTDAGIWRKREDGLWALRVVRPTPPPASEGVEFGGYERERAAFDAWWASKSDGYKRATARGANLSGVAWDAYYARALLAAERAERGGKGGNRA